MKKLALKQKRVLSLIKATEGRIFGVDFIKRTDGRVRSMTARLGVKKGQCGGTLPYNPEARNLLPVYEMPEGQYRLIPVESILRVRVDGVEAYAI